MVKKFLTQLNPTGRTSMLDRVVGFGRNNISEVSLRVLGL